MKITLDIDQLLADGRISQEEYERFKAFAAETTSSLALNIVLAFGVVTVASGTLVCLQSSLATAILGFGVGVIGAFLCSLSPRWKLLGSILLPLGALTGAGGIIAFGSGNVGSFLGVAALFLAGAIAARSGLLAALSVFALLSALGGSTGYEHAGYFLCIERPIWTVGAFSVLAAVAYVVSRSTPPAYSRLAAIFARTSVVVVHFGFWVGSLWGDRRYDAFRSDMFFIITWAVFILATGIWGARSNNRWLVNTAATFGAIHLYTQWFEHLGPNPIAIIFAGMILIAVAFALITYNRRIPAESASLSTDAPR